MKAFITVLLIMSTPSWADDEMPLPLQLDVPLVGQAMEIFEGEVAPFSGLLLDESAAIQAAQRIVSAEAERDALRNSVKFDPGVVAGFVIGSLLIGAAITGGVIYVTGMQPHPIGRP